MEIIQINGEDYIKKSDIKTIQKAEDFNDLEYKIIRTYSAGVFAWYLEKREWKEVILRKARRLRYWDWAASLSQLAEEWVSKPENCKFPCEIDKVELLEVIEILDVTQQAKDSIDSVKIWKK